MKKVLKETELKQLNMWWDASNYLAAAQLYLLDNPLLEEPLAREQIKHKIVGHWGTVPGQNFIYTHLNRIIKKYDVDMIYLSGPGHGGNGMVAQDWLDGSYSEVYPNVSQDKDGLKKLFKQFSFPGGISSHVAPETPGSIHEGGELGYSLAHAYGAVLDNPELIAACVVGDGEAETGPLATSWQSNKFINPAKDGAVLPILHLNGYKIANPTILARTTDEDLKKFFEGMGYKPYFVEGSEADDMHQQMAYALEECYKGIRRIQQDAKAGKLKVGYKWPMIVMRSPKGWTGPKFVDGKAVEGTFRAHQVPIDMSKPEHLAQVEEWLRSYHPEKLFTKEGAPVAALKEMAPKGNRRMGANPHTNGGLLLKDLKLPDFKDYALEIDKPGCRMAQDMTELGGFVRDIVKMNPKNFRIFGPDETMSNRLNKVFEVTGRDWNGATIEGDEYLMPDGRIMDSMLSEHCCEGWLEGYLLTGRHGFFNSYEAFIRIVDSMASQHAKWLKVTSQIPWRAKIASLNYILSSNVWQQDHNGYTHQDPGFIDHIVSKKAEVVRVYLPADSNTLLCCFDHCIRSRNYINVMVTSKHPRPQWLTMDQAIKHCAQGVSIWQWASNDEDCEPDIVMACAGDGPTLETLAAVSLLRKRFPELKIRVVNVYDLMRLQDSTQHPHGLSQEDYDLLFTKDKPILFAYHGYPRLIHELTYKRHNQNMHVRGYKEEGTITTPFDMRVQNNVDRFHLAANAVKMISSLGNRGADFVQEMNDKLIEHKQYIAEYGCDLPEVENWVWDL